MSTPFSRREFFEMLGAGLLMPAAMRLRSSIRKSFRIRTITAGIELQSATDMEKVEEAFRFLERVREDFEAQDYEVQTLRIATQPLAEYLPDWMSAQALEVIKSFDQFASERNVMFNIGPVITDDRSVDGIGEWAVRLIRETSNISFTVHVASPTHGLHQIAALSAGEVIKALGEATPGGEGNFRFAATAYCPPGIPFFPAAFHRGPDAFAIGLESAGLVVEVFKEAADLNLAREMLTARMNAACAPVEKPATRISEQGGRRYLGIDTSPAPGLEASMGEAVETLIRAPFGSPLTLSACAAITDALKDMSVKTCGYSGLMLPVLEDRVLAQRAAEGTYDIQDLLLYSSVCGTGLDVVPLPGDATVDDLASIILDVASLSHKYRKPLSARLFPVPGKAVGEVVHFENAFLTDSVVMALN